MFPMRHRRPPSRALSRVFQTNGLEARFRVADDTPGTMLADATGNYRLAPTSKNYTLNRPPRAGVCSPFRIAHIENKGRLPRGVTQDFAKQASPQRRFSQPFHGRSFPLIRCRGVRPGREQLPANAPAAKFSLRVDSVPGCNGHAPQ